jgi:hypothetical protein
MSKTRSKIQLPNVTLVCISGVNIFHSIFALWRSSRKIQFSSVKLISNKRPRILPPQIIFEKSVDTELDSIDEYNRYVIYKLWRHIETEHCLIVQADGYVLNPTLWKPEFLEFDYIGAPWPIKDDAYIDPFGNHQRVGNGGFSLRSKKLLTVPSSTEVPWEVNFGNFYRHEGAGLYSEDGNICVHNRHIYEAHGCRWPDVSLALEFSVESRVTEYKGAATFGFHKRFPSLKLRTIEALAKARFALGFCLLRVMQTLGLRRLFRSK